MSYVKTFKKINLKKEEAAHFAFSDVTAKGYTKIEKHITIDDTMSNHCKPIICLDTGKVYGSVTSAAKELGVYASSVSWVITGRMETVKGLHFCRVCDLPEKYKEVSERLSLNNSSSELKKVYEEVRNLNTKLKQTKDELRKLKIELAESNLKYQRAKMKIQLLKQIDWEV